ncbi:MAG: hypothetical protein KBS81_03835 [Spirochaetales bacterium]|nr:hypothetical protein [Candidatus Physcosoma equi]
MLYTYQKDFDVSYSSSYANLTLSLERAIEMIQDAMTWYFASFGGDNRTVLQKDKAVWVISKTRVLFHQALPEWCETLHSETYTTQVRMLAVKCESAFSNGKGEPLFTSQIEACPIDMEKRRIKKVSEVTYPKDMETKESIFTTDYERLVEEFHEEDLIYRSRVRTTDVDMSNHTNNSVYVRWLMDALTLEEIKYFAPKSFEINYRKEVLLGEDYSVYAKRKENAIHFLIANSEKEIARALLVF